MAQPQSRRSQGTIFHRREQLEWPADDLRILSIDGGGIRGILPAAVLAECERRFLKGSTAASYFDMIAGTSTGGIIALGMAAGMRAEEVLEIYMRHGSKIFPQPWTPPTRLGRAMRSAYQFARDLAVYRYNREPLERALRDRFGNRTLGSVNVCLNIPAFDGFNEVNVLKTPHHPDFRLDWQEELVTVALATSAAPTFFATYRNGTRHFADGGVWANNPVMVALVDAMSCFNIDRHKIKILSLGCGDQDLRMTDGQIKRGGMFHWRTIVESAMHLQSQNALGQAGLLIGRNRMLRLTSAPTLEPIALDDFTRASAELPQHAKRLVEENATRLEKLFDLERPRATFFHGLHKC
ncbi:CBASS cGAMP-activated phospholipase [Frigidibacter sp. ROC022]|uniref:CBASS cGAMP-activated phospholipase n=1 Tax=Frigidibacter sp. ROC022 TaxID=2971796 RepID=UPI00215AFAFE|nr:CBASS cGAMP-activated phospholipase [Frigidibacter sp. ROC022]MCR8724514.1 CBASS cGAMP-activated phospholipase [Frigidibacter sp. ROC022]